MLRIIQVLCIVLIAYLIIAIVGNDSQVHDDEKNNVPVNKEVSNNKNTSGIKELVKSIDNDKQAAKVGTNQENLTDPSHDSTNDNKEHVSSKEKRVYKPSKYSKNENPHFVKMARNMERAITEGYGTTEPFSEEELKNPQTRSMVEAVKNGSNPERVSVLAKPTDFDEHRWLNDEKYRENYLRVAEPSRVDLTKQPGPDVPKIDRVSPYFQKVVQGEKVTLSVKVPDGYPVTFTSYDLGKLGNGATTHTVVSKNGVASTEFHGIKGTIMDTNILASSPMTTGQIKFIVHTLLPQKKS